MDAGGYEVTDIALYYPYMTDTLRKELVDLGWELKGDHHNWLVVHDRPQDQQDRELPMAVGESASRSS